AHTHSILFHFEGQPRRQAEVAQEAKDAAALKSLDGDLLARQQQFDALLAQRSVMDSLTPYGGGYVGLTGFGAMQWRDLGLRLYRASDVDFAAYWQEVQHVDQELNDIG